MWEFPAGKLLRRVPEEEGRFHEKHVFDLAPDGTLLAIVKQTDQPDGGVVELRDATTGKPVRRLARTPSPVHYPKFSPDGKTLAGIYPEGNLCLWDVKSGDKLRELHGESLACTGLIFAPDGQMLIAVTQDSPSAQPAYALWDLRRGKQIRAWTGPKGLSAHLLLSPDGHTLACGEPGATRLSDLLTGKELRRLPGPKGLGATLAFSADGRLLASSDRGDHALELWDLATGKEVRRWGRETPDYPWSLAFSPDGKVLAAGGTGGTIRLWEVVTGKEIRPTGDGPHWISAAALSPHGETLPTGDPEGSLQLWDARTGRRLAQLPGTGEPITHLAFGPKGRQLSAAGRGGARVLEVPSGRVVRRLSLDSETAPAALSDDGRILAAYRSAPRETQFYDLVAGKPLGRIRDEKYLVLCYTLSPDGASAVVDASLVPLDQVKPGQTTVLYGVGSQLEFRMDVWNVATGKKTFSIPGRDPPVAFSPDGRWLAWGDGRGKLLLEDTVRGSRLPSVRISREENESGTPDDNASCVAWSPDARSVAWADGAGIIHVSEVASGKDRLGLEGRRNAVRRVPFSSDGTLLISLGDDHIAVAWDLAGRASHAQTPPELSSAERETL